MSYRAGWIGSTRRKQTDEVRWFEKRGRGFALHITPLEVSEVFNEFQGNGRRRLGIHFGDAFGAG